MKLNLRVLLTLAVALCVMCALGEFNHRQCVTVFINKFTTILGHGFSGLSGARCVVDMLGAFAAGFIILDVVLVGSIIAFMFFSVKNTGLEDK